MQLDEKSKEMKRMMDAMRPLTDAEMAERQRLAASGMQNAGMRPVPGMQNMWASEPWHWIPEPPKPTFWQRLRMLFVRHNL